MRFKDLIQIQVFTVIVEEADVVVRMKGTGMF